ncbi:MAG: Alpha-D-ribose 1-methylphosphonate 5-triphosphate synthase subunit PhnG [uncultured Microvirga sp.]|uniref:Alpha-D-ribose 1-methylphosphonate 5-triphosphate synthase subunit PhnG n=1 Tax=uncultured Microvirga sp. TaxID=412392 RepID=A0A6J4M2F1_9HYPH|nr:MAG: Alpha-D-ribose 1-methylphosphonate 5-triphosphate synthase subunit PhnG [uncultured Microvirga sp.]
MIESTTRLRPAGPEPTAGEVGLRQAVMALCAQADPGELLAALERIEHGLDVEDLRRTETGLVMVRGRIGGDGRPFNLGEATVTRAAVRIASGETGFAYQLGRDAPKARHAAILDALWQSETHREAVEAALGPIRDRLADECAGAERQTAATRVNFFTMVRGED